MNKVYKAAIFISSFLLILFIGQVLFAQGKGYFLEKNGSLYILDNLHINGYLAVENTLSSASGLPGDVLVGQNLFLDENKKLYFCQDDRAVKGNTPLNLDCANKSLSWNPEGLEVKNNSYQLTTETLSAVNSINFNVVNGTKISTDSSVRLTNEGSNCFSNNGSDDCNTNELKTGSMIIDSLAPLNERNLNFTAQKLIFKEINLGPEANMDNQYICWAASAAASNNCLTAKEGNRASGGAKWDFTLPGGTTYAGTIDANGVKLCCHLNINF